MINRTSKLISTLIAIAFIAAACGGGGSDESNATVATPNPDDNTSGITGTGKVRSRGPISGFGSVIVNGVTYDTSSAMFTKDGVAASQSDFAVGQVVLVTGTIDDSNTSGTADSVVFDDTVEGPVESVDSVAGSIVVLGQTVLISAATSIDDSCPSSLSELAGVPAVEVSGPVKADGSVEATRIECKLVAGEFEVTGVVSNLDSGAMTFQINALVVDYGSAAVDNFPTAGVINNGDPVEAKGVSFGGGGELEATRVEYKGGELAGDEGDRLEIEGFVTRFGSSSDFDVSGQRVSTNDSTVYEGGVAGDIGMNLKIEVEGLLDANGILVASKVELKQATNVRVVGRIDSISGSTVTVLNIPITTDLITTRFEDKTDADVDPLRVGDLNVDDYIEARGQEFPAGSGEISALLLERDDPREESELRGFVDSGGVNRPSLTVLGVTIDTSGGTVYRGLNDQVLSADEFWTAVNEGSLVDVKGLETGPSTLAAEELSFE
jgi:hypothetical protein